MEIVNVLRHDRNIKIVLELGKYFVTAIGFNFEGAFASLIVKVKYSGGTSSTRKPSHNPLESRNVGMPLS
jgi:hypothetical protein